MIAASFSLTLTLQGPVMTNSSVRGGFGVDSVMAQTGGTFYLPGTLVKGLLGEAWQELASIDPAFGGLQRRWLGEESQTQNLPERGTLFFEDLLDRKTAIDGKRTQ